MIEKYFLHRIQRDGGVFSKGIEIHDTLDAAILSYWGRVKLAYGASQGIDCLFVKITDKAGNVVDNYDFAWKAAGVSLAGMFFMHHIRYDGDTPNKDIDICNDFGAACVAFAAAMEYGYGNPKHSNVKYVSCEITDDGGVVMNPYKKYWEEPEPEPNNE